MLFFFLGRSKGKLKLQNLWSITKRGLDKCTKLKLFFSKNKELIRRGGRVGRLRLI